MRDRNDDGLLAVFALVLFVCCLLMFGFGIAIGWAIWG